jgi:hypothetical protein
VATGSWLTSLNALRLGSTTTSWSDSNSTTTRPETKLGIHGSFFKFWVWFDLSCFILPNSTLREPHNFAAVAAQRVLFVSKKPAVGEAFKISLGDNTQHRAPSLEQVRLNGAQVVALKRRSRASRHQWNWSSFYYLPEGLQVQSLVFHRDGMVSISGMCVLELLQGRQTTPLFLSNIIVYFESGQSLISSDTWLITYSGRYHAWNSLIRKG